MQIEQALSRVKNMRPEEHMRWVLLLGHELTISARDAYVPASDQADGHLLRLFNELQHRLYGYMLAELDRRSRGLDQLLKSLYAAQTAASGLVEQAVSRSFRTLDSK